MKTKDKKRFLAVMLCAVKVLSSVNINIPVLAEEETETEECVHEHTVIREEAGPEPTCMEDGYHTVISLCEDCGKELSVETVTDPATGHDYHEVSRTEATEEAEGVAVYECTRCGDTYTEVLPRLEISEKIAEELPAEIPDEEELSGEDMAGETPLDEEQAETGEEPEEDPEEENSEFSISGEKEELTAKNAETDPIIYRERYWDPETKTVKYTDKECTSYELLHNSSSSWYTIGKDGETTWYVAQGNITMNGTTLTVRGDVNIILCDGADVTIKDGVEVKTGYSLTIYGQSEDSGKLYAKNNDQDAGIGCGPNSGVGDITIHGGVIEAHGGKYAAGIGSGDERQMGSHITIYGGDVKAYGGDYGAGIGSGDETSGDNGYIDIYGGTIYAKGGIDGAGIGGGNEGNGRHITIWGGKITALAGDSQAAGIGGGDDGGGGYITINGGDIEATGKAEGPGIGGDSNCGTIIINGGTVNASAEDGAGIGGAYGENLVKGSITINDGNVTAWSTGRNDQDGNDESGSAGIGSGQNGNLGGGDLCIPITINGGSVYAKGSYGSAGIGSAAGGDVKSQITINGGDVTAISGEKYGAGIGAGSEIGNDGGNVKKKIIITGGTVFAEASEGGNAIGHAKDCSSAGVQLYDYAKVTAGSSQYNMALQTNDKRLSGLDKRYAKIEPCKHPDIKSIYYDGFGHEKVCGYCDYLEYEYHDFTSSDICVCGADKNASLHVLLFKEKKGTDDIINRIGVVNGTDFTFPEPWYSSDEYHFDGWKNGETLYQPGDVLTNVTVGNITFTAQYTKYCRIRFDANFGSGTMDDVFVMPGEQIVLPECDYTYSYGEVFLGWRFNNELMQPGDKITVTSDITFVVEWGYPSHVHDGITFETLENNYYLQTTPGNYYLNYIDVVLPSRINKPGVYNVCLNGHELYITESESGLNGLTVPDGVTLNIYDETGDGLITILENHADKKTNTPAVTIESGGTVNLYGGKITGINSSCDNGGAVYVRNGGTFNMYGGRIMGNSAAVLGGGVYVEKGGTFGISGTVKVANNHSGNNEDDSKYSNVYLENDAVITVLGNLETYIGVSCAEGRKDAVTSGLGDKGTTDDFFSDDSGYMIGLSPEGEILVGTPVTVTFDSSGASGTMETVNVASGSMFELPECGFDAPENKQFEGWLVNDEVRSPGEVITVTDSITIIAQWTGTDEPVFKTQSLVLSGDINVCFYMDLSGLSAEEKAESYMTFSMPYGNQPAEVKFNEAKMNEKEYYGFKCSVNSIQMAEEITAVFHYRGDQTVEKKYSVAQYLSNFDKHASEFDEKTLNLVHALADYGHYVQPFLSEARGWAIVKPGENDGYAEMDKHYTESYDFNTVKAAVEGNAVSVDNKCSDITKITYSLTLDSETAINVYFKPAEGFSGPLDVTVDGQAAEAVLKSGRYVVTIPGISAHLLDDTHLISVTSGNGTAAVTVSALSYVKSMLDVYTDENDSEKKARNAAASIWYYSAAANALKD